MTLDGLRITMLVTNDVARDARVLKEAASAAEAGAAVTVVGVGNGEDGSDDEVYRVRLIKPSPPSAHPLWPLRVTRNLLSERRLDDRLVSAAIESQPQVIHSNDLDTLHVGAEVSSRTGARLVYDAHELFAETAGRRWWRRELLRMRERRHISAADRVLTVNPLIAELLQQRHRLAEKPLVVYNGPSACLDRPSPDNTPVRLLYQGAFHPNRGLEALVSSMDPLRDTCELVLQGWGTLEDELRGIVQRRRLDRVVHFRPPCPPHEVVRQAALCDVGVIVHKADSLNNKLSSPNKLFDYMGAGLAVLASDLPFLRSVIEAERCGALFDPAVDGSIAETVRTLAADPIALRQMKRNSAAACSKFAWSEQERVLVGVYEQLKMDLASESASQTLGNRPRSGMR